MCCAWKFHPFQFKCVCSSYCCKKRKNYSDNNSGRSYKQGTPTVKGLTNKVLEHVKATEGWWFTRLDGRFGSVSNWEGTESSSAWLLVCFLYAIVTLLFMLILHKLCFYKEAVLRCFVLISIFCTSSNKEDNSSNRVVGSVRSSFQKVQRIDELKFLYASFMLSLRYRSCGFYKDYDMTKMSPKKFCYVNTMVLCLFILWWCYFSQYQSCLFEETLSSYCYTFTRSLNLDNDTSLDLPTRW